MRRQRRFQRVHKRNFKDRFLTRRALFGGVFSMGGNKIGNGQMFCGVRILASRVASRWLGKYSFFTRWRDGNISVCIGTIGDTFCSCLFAQRGARAVATSDRRERRSLARVSESLHFNARLRGSRYRCRDEQKKHQMLHRPSQMHRQFTSFVLKLYSLRF